MAKFDDWNIVKKVTDQNTRTIGIKPREIFWAKIGENVGYEQNGKGENFARPVIIVKKLTHELFLGIPLSNTIRPDSDYFHAFEYHNTANGLVTNSALILQTKVFSIKRLMNKTGIVDKDNFDLILEKGKSLFSPTP
ncbi:MAG: type II toxin-antitoxin system PemK/MazF family toxin [Sulfuricurvum sp.]|nr:type II toxin-antitoxin system PemK/MazF family toxin [Sulfuricurvum sp.]